ncbi:MAG: ATP-dependent Clp protease proteolytic subunit [Bacteroidota bacterium]
MIDPMSQNEFQKYWSMHLNKSSMTLHDYQSATNKQMGSIPGIYGLTPNIIEERQMNVVAMDVFSRLMMDRIIFLGMAIMPQVANIVSAQLLFLQSVDSSKDISIYINSPGGSVYDGLGIYDTMQLVSPDVATIVTGMAASMGSVLLTAGTDGKRAALPHSRVMIHQPLGGTQGQASDLNIYVNEMNKVRDELYTIIARHTKQSFDTIAKDSDRDNWFTAEEAKAYGLVDEVLAGGAPKA